MVGNPSAVVFQETILSCSSFKVGESRRQSLVSWIQGPTSLWREGWEVFISVWMESSLKLLCHQEVFGVGLKNERPGRVCEERRFCEEKTKEFFK